MTTHKSRVDDELQKGSAASVIRLVELLVEHAHAAKSSDIHLDPREGGMKVRLRTDGMLYDAHTLPPGIEAQVISRLKILSGLRIDEHHAAQDGRFRLRSERAVTGFMAWASVAPNTLQLLRYIGPKGNRFGERSKSAAGRLVAKGYANFVEENGKKFLRITPEGSRYLEIESQKSSTSSGKRKKRKWDGRWRMVVFDIPEKRKPIRQRLARLMSEYGFVRVQDSVWVFPYDCEEIIALTKIELRTGKDILYAVVQSIENDRWLKDAFQLK